MKQTLQIEGMHCGSCVGRVDKALHSVPGVKSAAVNLTTGLASVEYDSAPTDSQTADLVTAVQSAGYNAIPLRDVSASTMREVVQRGRAAQDRLKVRLIVGAVLGIPLVAWHMLHLPMFTGCAALELLIATLILLVTGWPYFRRGIPALIFARPDMDTLVALGAGTAYVASVPSSISEIMMHGMTHLTLFNEYHAAVTIIVLVTLGKFLEARAKKRAGAAVGGLAIKTNPEATLVRADGTTARISAEAVVIGDSLHVVAHQAIPVDGHVIDGTGSLDQSLLTGESVPVSISTGSTVPGGAMLLDGRIIIRRATATAAQSTIARITELVQQAQASRTKIQRLADRVAAIFVPIVLALALLTFVGWLLVTGDPWRGLLAAVATVVIACPCAMGLATPTAITVAMGRGAKLGILFTQATALETAHTIDTVLFDKTGTLTRGQLQVADVVAFGADARTVLSLAGSLEQFSEHPIAQAIMRRVRAEGITPEKPEQFSSIPGGGLKGQIGNTSILPMKAASDAPPVAPQRGTIGLRVLQPAVPLKPMTEILVGSLPFLQSQGVSLPGSAADALCARGMTVIAVASAKQPLGLIGLRDTLRDDAAATISKLRARGIKVGVISGDSEAAVRGSLANIPFDIIHAAVRPDGKSAIIKKLAADGRRVAFVGDGTNDAPALAAANLGIALSTGTDLARAAGDVILVSPHLSAVPQTLALADATLRIIRQNLIWAFGYNVLAIPLAMFNILPPGLAAGAMVFSSLSVVANALRLNRAGN